jgi:mevalonate kinase
VKASAPGKVILFGEHAVVYGRAALAVPVTQVQAEVEVSDSSRRGIWIDAPDVGLHAELRSLPADNPLAAVVHNLFFAVGVDPFPDLEIRISSTIPVASGLGSGAAVTVALIRALTSALHRRVTDEQVSAWAYEIEKLHHGTPSGIDNTVVTFAQPVFFVKDHPIEMLVVRTPFTIVIADTGVPAPTKASVADVRRLWESDRPRWDGVFDEIGRISLSARQAIEAGKPEQLGELMNRDHALLQQLTVSSPQLDRLVEASRGAGAHGAKLSGGGRGGNMIALVEADTQPAVLRSLNAAGAARVITTQVG